MALVVRFVEHEVDRLNTVRMCWPQQDDGIVLEIEPPSRLMQIRQLQALMKLEEFTEGDPRTIIH